MADTDAEKAKAEKLAAAKKKVEEMKKKKAKKVPAKKDDKIESAAESSKEEVATEPESGPKKGTQQAEEKGLSDRAEAGKTEPDGRELFKYSEEPVAELRDSKSHQRQTSLSIQSKMRSSSFRQSTGPISPDLTHSPEENTAPEIYRKQATRIEELEKENKKLSKEVNDGERRWKRAEDELEDLREAEGDGTKTTQSSSKSLEEVERLNSEITSLRRQNSQLQARSRHSSSPSVNINQNTELETALRSKTTTIESMEIELSTLRAQIERISSGTSIEKEQIAALEDKLARSERTAETAQGELSDLKRNLERTTEKAVKEGSERTSAETRVRSLERKYDESGQRAGEAERRAEGLEKKVEALTQLHRENDGRAQGVRREREGLEKEVTELRSKLSKIEDETSKLRGEKERWKKREEESGADSDAVEELENEERQKLLRRVRELESEVHDLRSGLYDKERGHMEGTDELGSPTRFTDVDLSGGSYPNGSSRGRTQNGGGKGFSDLLASGISAITGATAGSNGADDGLLDDDREMEFDEDAYQRAQEEEGKKRLERIREVKRSLKDWEGWRMDLVEERKAGGDGIGEIFEV